MLFTSPRHQVPKSDIQATNTRRVTRRGNDENAVPAQAVARTKSAATSLGPPQKVVQPSTGVTKKPAAPGGKVSGAKRTALGGVVNNSSNVKEELEDKPGTSPLMAMHSLTFSQSRASTPSVETECQWSTYRTRSASGQCQASYAHRRTRMRRGL